MEKVIKILIVDDFALIRKAWISLINANKLFSVIAEAKNGKEAITSFEENLPDIVLMDITMPVMDGIEATELLIVKNPEAKVIGLTMHSEIEFARKMIRAGARGYITKDCSQDELFKAIEKVVSGEIYISNHLNLFADLINEIQSLNRP